VLGVIAPRFFQDVKSVVERSFRRNSVRWTWGPLSPTYRLAAGESLKAFNNGPWGLPLRAEMQQPVYPFQAFTLAADAAYTATEIASLDLRSRLVDRDYLDAELRNPAFWLILGSSILRVRTQRGETIRGEFMGLTYEPRSGFQMSIVPEGSFYARQVPIEQRSLADFEIEKFVAHPTNQGRVQLQREHLASADIRSHFTSQIVHGAPAPLRTVRIEDDP
jgi:hypothetical protein